MDDSRACSFTATQFRRKDMEHMASALEAMGIDIDVCFSKAGRSARITVEIPAHLRNASEVRTRRAGRKRHHIKPPEDSPFTRDSTCEEFIEWLDRGHTASEAMAALGIESRATYFRRLKVIRTYAKKAKEQVPGVIDEEMPRRHPLLKDTDYHF